MSSYILKITGKRIDTFLMLLVRFSINFKMLKRGRDFIVIEVLEEDYDNLLKISTTYKIEIVKRKGLLNVVHFIKTRKLFVVMVCSNGFTWVSFL